MKLIRSIIFLTILCCQNSTYLFGQLSSGNRLIQNSIPKSNIYWLGEGHATASNYDIAFDLYCKIDSAVGVDYIPLESNYLQTHYLNKYLKSGDSNLLDLAFSTSVGTFGWTKEHKAYYENIYAHEQKKTKENRIQFVGIDIEHGYWHTHKFLIDSLIPSTISDSNRIISQISQPLRYSKDFFNYYKKLYDDVIQNEVAYKTMLGGQFEVTKYLIKNIYNITYYQSLPDNLWDVTRDSLIYENFKYYNERLQFKHKVSFGLWGTDHIFQATTKKGITYIAAHIKNNETEISQIGYRMLYTKSSFNMPTFFVPNFVRWIFGEKHYFKTKALNNDRIWSKVSGISFLKKRKNIGFNYPLSVDSIPQKIDLVGNRKKGYQNRDYFQYIILVRNSPVCTPLKNQF